MAYAGGPGSLIITEGGAPRFISEEERKGSNGDDVKDVGEVEWLLLLLLTPTTAGGAWAGKYCICGCREDPFDVDNGVGTSPLLVRRFGYGATTIDSGPRGFILILVEDFKWRGRDAYHHPVRCDSSR